MEEIKPAARPDPTGAEIPAVETDAVEATFGPLGVQMLAGNPVLHIWRISFLANFYTGPMYKAFDARWSIDRDRFLILFLLTQRSPLMARDVCLATGRPKNSISRAVTDLETRGLIERDTSTDDKRSKFLRITEPGKRILETLLPEAVRRQTAMLDALSEEERDQLAALLLKLANASPAWVGEDHGAGPGA